MKTMLQTTQVLVIRCQQKCSCLSPRDSTKTFCSSVYSIKNNFCPIENRLRRLPRPMKKRFTLHFVVHAALFNTQSGRSRPLLSRCTLLSNAHGLFLTTHVFATALQLWPQNNRRLPRTSSGSCSADCHSFALLFTGPPSVHPRVCGWGALLRSTISDEPHRVSFPFRLVALV